MNNAARFPKVLCTTAWIVSLATLGTWLFTGTHTGWTQTRVITLQHDEITGIEYPVFHDAFVAGVEFLAAGLVIGAALAAFGLWLGRKRTAAHV